MHIAILGGGPSGLFVFKQLLEAGIGDLAITIFERQDRLGIGMPYGNEGATKEHLANISGKEIPSLAIPFKEWIRKEGKGLPFSKEVFDGDRVMPRLLLGDYLSAQFDLLLDRAKTSGVQTEVKLNIEVKDVVYDQENLSVSVIDKEDRSYSFDSIIIATGHHWPVRYEGRFPNYFESPYPPAKLALKVDYPVAIKGASLTAIDAVRTLALCNGVFTANEEGMLDYKVHEECKGFRIVMHSLEGMLPGIRFHLEEDELPKSLVLSPEEIRDIKKKNDGFVPLDYLFNQVFRESLRDRDPALYRETESMSMEEFVQHIMSIRQRLDPFVLFKAEYKEAVRSLRRNESIHWKELLGVLSFVLNYPAKHLSAEDMTRLTKVLMPLVSIVIAFVPQRSCQELLALYDAGLLELKAVDENSEVEPRDSGGAIYTYVNENGSKTHTHYSLYIDCTGQPHLDIDQFPFKSLVSVGIVSPAKLQYRLSSRGNEEMQAGNKKVEKDGNGNYFLRVPGIAINDYFQVVDRYNAYNESIFIMAVPYISGHNPDYSGLDFCEKASELIVEGLLKNEKTVDK